MSGDRYVITDQQQVYFLTLTVVDWVDVFTRKDYKLIIVDSLNFCIANKGMEVFAYVIMSNHLHLITRAKEGYVLSYVLRDFKKFTSKQIVAKILEIGESRRDWASINLLLKPSEQEEQKTIKYGVMIIMPFVWKKRMD